MRLRKKDVGFDDSDLDNLENDDSDLNSEDFDDDFDDSDLGEDSFGGEDFGDSDSSGTPLNKHNDLLKELTNFDPYLRETFNNWLGITWDESAQQFKRNPLLKPMMSFQGASFGGGLMKTYARKNNIITDISHDDYIDMMCDHIDAIWLNYGTRDDLGVLDDGDLIRVANELEHSAKLVLMGAGDGKYNKMLGTTYSHHTSGNVEGSSNMQRGNVQFGNKKPSMLDKARNFLVGQGNNNGGSRRW